MTATDPLTNLFEEHSKGSQMMMQLLRDANVSQITCDAWDRVIYTDGGGPKKAEVFANPKEYVAWINELLPLTDAGYTDVEAAKTSVIEGSFRPDRIQVHGSIHLCTREITRSEPSLTIRKQPIEIITLDDMLQQGMMNAEMHQFLQAAIHGRANILISGGSGAGKTTLARALSHYIDPWHRVITCEEIDELHLYDRLMNVVPLTTFRKRDEEGALLRETTLQDLVREALRMRGDRVWVGETRGAEAYALVKACNSGHDGSVTTMHADNGKQAVKQVVTYVMEAGLPDATAREQVAQAFDLVVQISKVRMGKRVVTEISQLEKVIEGDREQRLIELYKFDADTEGFARMGQPSRQFMHKLEVNGVNGLFAPAQQVGYSR